MAVLTLADAKAHLRIDDDEQDGYIQQLIDAAEAAIADMMLRPLIDEIEWTDAAAVPANVKHAVRLVLGDFYGNREGVVTGTIAAAIPSAANVRALIGRYVRYPLG